jgi:hypothetical protein
MTKTFTGDVLLPGDTGGGLTATLILDPERVTLTAGDNQLGSWDRSDYLITPEENGSFNLTLGGESVLFRPDSPSEFSSTSAVPLSETLSRRTAPSSLSGEAKDEDDYIDAAIANIRPLRDPQDDGGMSRTFVGVMAALAAVISLAAVVTAALV